MGRFRITQDGYNKIKAELDHLLNVERPAIAKAIGEARELGDLSENQEYSSSKEKQSVIEGMISSLSKKLADAEIVDITKCSGEEIGFGAIVHLVDEDTDKEIKYQILSEYEADISKGKISIESPIAKALIGKIVGESVEIKIPSGVKNYEILNIEWGKLI